MASSSVTPPLELLGDDLLERVLSLLDSQQLRAVAPTCRRWAALLRSPRKELWSSVAFALPPRRSRGRDRRQSYTTPCALHVPRIAAWLAHRAGAIARLEIVCQYPDALALLPELVPPLACGLQELVVRGSCRDWPFLGVSWDWLAGLTRLESLRLHDALPALALDGCLPPSLTELYVDRVGEELGGAAEEEEDVGMLGWDVFPASLAKLPRLAALTLGTCRATWAEDGEEAALAPLAACTALRHLALPGSTLSALPAQLPVLRQHLTSLSMAGTRGLAGGGTGAGSAAAFAPLAALSRLQVLDLSDCRLACLPAQVLGLTSLRELLLRGNAQLLALPAGPCWARLTRLDAAGCTGLTALPVPLLLDASELEELDLSGCDIKASAEEWEALLALPRLWLLTHSAAGAERAAQRARRGAAAPRLELRHVPLRSKRLLHGSSSAPALMDAEQLELLQAAALLLPA